MRCPICGSSMKHGFCEYCKITSEQVENASNKAVSKARKEGRKHEIYYSSTMPKDVNAMLLKLFTIFFGWCGVGSFYVKRNIRGIFSVSIIAIALLFYVIGEFAGNLGVVFQAFYEIAFYACAVNMVMWVWDIFELFIKAYKVPVVLGEKKQAGKYNKKSKEKMIEELQEEILDDVKKERKTKKSAKKDEKTE